MVSVCLHFCLCAETGDGWFGIYFPTTPLLLSCTLVCAAEAEG